MTYFAQQRHSDAAARPSVWDRRKAERERAASLDAPPPVEHSMLPGKAYEEMTVKELRRIAGERGVAWRDADKETLIARLRAH